jgi:hyperosmotically inducible protein
MTPHATRKILVVAVMGAFIGVAVLVFALSPKTPGPAPETTTASATITPTAVVPAAPAQPAESAVVTAPSAPLAATLPPTAVTTTAVETKSTHERKSIGSAGAREPTGPAVADRTALARQADADSSSRHAEPMVTSEAILPVTPEPVGQPVASDNSITSDVKSQFAADSVGKDVDIGVTTTQGAVVLSGTLGSQDAIEHVKGVAERVKDVKSVDVTALKIASL